METAERFKLYALAADAAHLTARECANRWLAFAAALAGAVSWACVLAPGAITEEIEADDATQ